MHKEMGRETKAVLSIVKVTMQLAVGWAYMSEHLPSFLSAETQLPSQSSSLSCLLPEPSETQGFPKSGAETTSLPLTLILFCYLLLWTIPCLVQKEQLVLN